MHFGTIQCWQFCEVLCGTVITFAVADNLRLERLPAHAGSMPKGCLCLGVTGLSVRTALAHKQRWGQQVSVTPLCATSSQ